MKESPGITHVNRQQQHDGHLYYNKQVNDKQITKQHTKKLTNKEY